MDNKDLIIIIGLFCLVDGIRNGILNAVVFAVRNTPNLILFLGSTLLRSPWLLMALFASVRNYFTSPIFMKRVRKFKTLKRGYYAFNLIVVVFLFSWFLPLFVTGTAWYVSYEGQSYYPVVYELPLISKLPFYPRKQYYNKDFGLPGQDPVNYRDLKAHFQARAQGTVLLAPYEYGPYENNMAEYKTKEPPHHPDGRHWFGTDDRGRDVFARLAYGFNISMTFALLVTFFSYLIGISIGGYLGYYGGIFDIIFQRFVEIWSAVPFLYAIMIVVSIVGEVGLGWLVFLLVIFQWMGMTFYIRGEFLREKAKDYVSAAVSIGQKDQTIIFRHILPNALTPVISFMPFAIVGNISALVSLDFLGFGLAPPTASWGELMTQGKSHLTDPWLVAAPIAALFLTLMLVSFIGEAVREAFDPKQYSRLR